MDTVRVDICYRPLRICWAVQAGDISAFREAVRLSHTLWGGRFNPIVVVEHGEQAEQLVDLFRVDLILPIGDAQVVKGFPKHFPHLISPFFSDTLFLGGANERRYAQVLDIQNALVHLRETPEWKATKGEGFRIYTWQPDDPLADVFMIQLGMYPDVKEYGIDYKGILMDTAEAKEDTIDPTSPIPADSLERPTISSLSRYGLERHYSVRSGWDSPGFFVGDSSCLDDLVCHWNLRAADIPLWFVDLNHASRYTNIIPAWDKLVRDKVSSRHEFDRHVALWSRRENIDKAQELFTILPLAKCPASKELWNGRNVIPPMMHFGQISTLGVIGRGASKPRISFPLSEKPFSGDNWFATQYLVASVSFIGGLYGEEQHTLNPPFIPELNEFYARTIHFEHNKLRIEPERIGLVISAPDKDTFIYALPVADLVERMFEMAGFSARLSPGGLITRQLIVWLGGLRGAIVFKIPGVRRLLKTHGPTSAFTKTSAVQLIGRKDPDNPKANFNDYQYLYIGRRQPDTKLNPIDVFTYLVEKGLFRIGVELHCPGCRMASWIALDVLKQRVVCELCGSEYDATRQLVNGEWYYRRSGVLGAERNAQGAIPVALTLQQLNANFPGIMHENLYSPSLDLEPIKATLPKCEVDFVWIIARRYPSKTVVILGECKDQGIIDANDIDNLRWVADAFPRKRFETFVVLSKLCPFTPHEIERARTLNTQYSPRAILLTDQELEPARFFDRLGGEFKIKHRASTPQDLALATIEMYFKEPASDGG